MDSGPTLYFRFYGFVVRGATNLVYQCKRIGRRLIAAPSDVLVRP
jgi:hypothetical protein